MMLGMRRVLMCLCAFTITALTPAFAAVPPPAAPAASASPAADEELQCPVRVFNVVPVDATTGPAHTYAITFENAAPTSGRLGGTVSLFSGNDRYDAKFAPVVASGWLAADLKEATPVVVRLPKAVKVDAAYLSALDGSDGGPCAAAFVWMPRDDKPTSSLAHVFGQYGDLLRTRAKNIAPIATTAAIPQPNPGCAHPNVAAHITQHANTAGLLGGEELAQGSFITEVSLAETGHVLDAWLWGYASGEGMSSGMDQVTINVAKASTYAAEVFRCKSVASVFMGESDFTQHQTGGRE
jgi:hypothetical protein